VEHGKNVKEMVTPSQTASDEDHAKKEQDKVEDSEKQQVHVSVEVEDVTSRSSVMGENLINDAEKVLMSKASVPSLEVPAHEQSIQINIQPMDLITTKMEEVTETDNLLDGMFVEASMDGREQNCEDDVKSTCTSGTSDWQVVDDAAQSTDYMVAQAAQLIGSTLFQSDMTSDHPKHYSGDSVTSGLTSVPSLKSKSEISAVLLARWENELRQLHEFGFLDDHANVDALGHLEAANIGVESDDPITINAVVDYLLKQKQIDNEHES
jgi:hypothetical protein